MKNKYPPIVRVDESGFPIGPVDYREAHPQDQTVQGIPHLGSTMFIFESPSQERVLLSLRGEKVSGSGKWDSSAGGHTIWLERKNRAQTPIETAYREVNEELFSDSGIPQGLRLEQISSFWKQTRPNDHEYVHLFAGIYAGPFRTNPEEVAEVRFFTVKGTLQNLSQHPSSYTSSVGVCLREYMKARG